MAYAGPPSSVLRVTLTVRKAGRVVDGQLEEHPPGRGPDAAAQEVQAVIGEEMVGHKARGFLKHGASDWERGHERHRAGPTGAEAPATPSFRITAPQTLKVMLVGQDYFSTIRLSNKTHSFLIG